MKKTLEIIDFCLEVSLSGSDFVDTKDLLFWQKTSFGELMFLINFSFRDSKTLVLLSQKLNTSDGPIIANNADMFPA